MQPSIGVGDVLDDNGVLWRWQPRAHALRRRPLAIGSSSRTCDGDPMMLEVLTYRYKGTREPILTVLGASNLLIGAADSRQRHGKGNSDSIASQK